MNHTDSHETPKNLQKNNDAGKCPQESYDASIRKGDEAIVAEDIVLAEKYYQYADHYLRLMNDPNLFERDPDTWPITPARSVEESIAKALKGIAAERAARKEAFREKAIEAARGAKTAGLEKQVVKTKATQRKRTEQAKALRAKKVVNKKTKNRDEPCKIIFLSSITPSSGGENQS